MKSTIHPTYFDKAKVTCACGNTFETGSTKEAIEVELCGKCHPFYTGQQKLIDTAGNVEKFKEKLERAKKAEEDRKARLEKKKERKSGKTKEASFTLQDLSKDKAKGAFMKKMDVAEGASDVVVKKAPAKKTAAKKTSEKKAPAKKKTTTKKPAAKKAPAKKAATKKKDS